MNYLEQYKHWLSDPYFDEATREELRAIGNDEKEIQDRFYRDLEFGTGGLRGVIGAGTNRMNLYTVRKASQGLANYIIGQSGESKGIAIAHDSRRFSREFAIETALCMAANGIRAYVFEDLRPTPELSYALRKLGCIAGVVITASHNPPQYNGYKVYWEDGAQITFPKDKEIIAEVNAIGDFHQVKTMPMEEAVAKGLYVTIGKEMDDSYIEELKKLILHPEIIAAVNKEIKIVYTPLHGTGNLLVRRVLSELGFTNVYVVKEQELPDPDFSTVKSPNPEDPKAFALALKLAEEVDADIVLATDPDADRLGIYVKDAGSGRYIPFTGNMSGTLICEYILRERTAGGTMPEHPAIVSTIVTTDMARAIAEQYQVRFIEVLTGFKYIGEQIHLFETTGEGSFVFGMEESYGCLAGTHARDKDAVVAVMCLCEVAAWCRYHKSTLWDMMLAMYEKYGYYKETQHTITLEGLEGRRQIGVIMDRFRNEPMTEMGTFKVTAVRDYQTGKAKNPVTGEEYPLDLPVSNVVYFELGQDGWCCVRPSGTEPKIKFYMGVKGKSMEKAQERLDRLVQFIQNGV